jgi:hypothetical protein
LITPLQGFALWVAPRKIKIKEIKVSKSFHGFQLLSFKTYRTGIVKEKLNLAHPQFSSTLLRVKSLDDADSRRITEISEPMAAPIRVKVDI